MGDFFTSDKAAVKQQRKGSMLMRMADAIKDAFKGMHDHSKTKATYM